MTEDRAALRRGRLARLQSEMRSRELYGGEVGGREGVKLGEQLGVSATGVRNLVPYPYDERLRR
jgi:hypothetical protein